MLISITPAAPIIGSVVLSDALMLQHVKPSKADTLVAATMRDAALRWVENYTGVSLMQREFVAQFSCVAGRMVLPRRPVASITSITFAGPAGPSPDLASRFRIIGDTIDFSRGQGVFLGDAVSVRFVAGFADQPALPPTLTVAALMLTRHLYDGGTTDDLPATIMTLVDQGDRIPVIA